MVVDGKPLQKYPVTANATQSSILGPSSFLIYINDFRDYTICNIANYADNTILYSKWWWLGPWYVTTDIDIGFCNWIWWSRHCGLGRKWIDDLMLEKRNWFNLTLWLHVVLLIWKWITLSLMKNHILRRWDCLEGSRINWDSYIVSIVSKKNGALIISMKFLFSEVVLFSISLAWIAVIMSSVVVLVSTWICLICHRIRYIGFFMLHLHFLLNPVILGLFPISFFIPFTSFSTYFL